MGSKVSTGLGGTVEVSPNGEPVKVMTPDGRTITVSRKLVDLFPEKYTEIPAGRQATAEQPKAGAE